MRGLPSILSLFPNSFDKFNNTKARMLDSIYHMTLRLLWNLISGVKNVIILSLYPQRCYGRQILLHGRRDVICQTLCLIWTSLMKAEKGNSRQLDITCIR